MEEQDRVEVAIVGKNVYLKPFGLASQDNSLGIPDFLRAMLRAGCHCVVFDLAECTGMDSTFFGVIADAATVVPHRVGKTVAILNAKERAVRQLQRIGVLPLVALRKEQVEPPAGIQLRQIDFVHFPKTEQQRLEKIKKLHKQLAQLNEQNRQAFGPFVTMLEEEMHLHRDDEAGTVDDGQ